MTHMSEKSWSVGLPCFLALTPVEGAAPGTYDVSLSVDVTEVGVAVRESAGEFDDVPDVTDDESVVIEAFIAGVYAETRKGNPIDTITLRMEPTMYRVTLAP